MKNALKICCGGSNPELSQQICRVLGIELTPLEVSRFSNDNLSVQIQESVREKDVFVIQSLTEPVSHNLMTLLITLDALRSASARRITAVIPYYSYARSDKKDAPRISIAGRLIADLLKVSGADRVLTMDLHSDQVHGFFSMPVDHLSAIPLMAEYFKNNFQLSDLVAVATDAGGAKRAARFAEQIGIPLAIIDKRRISDTEVSQGHVVGDVKNRDAIIFDDEISTGGTICKTVDTLKQAGVNRVIAGAVHPVFCGPAVERLTSTAFNSVVVTNTVEIPESKRFPALTTLSTAPLFAEAIRRIHTGESMGELFH